MHHFQTNYLECIKTGRNDSKFTIGKYLINTMEIVKLFRVNIFMSVTKFPHLTIWLFYKMEIIKLPRVNIFIPVTKFSGLTIWLFYKMEIIKLSRVNIFMSVTKFPRLTIWLFYKMEIIKLSRVDIFMPITKFPYLTIWLFCKRRPFQIFGQFRVLFNETKSKNLGVLYTKITQIFKVAKSSNMGTKNR